MLLFVYFFQINFIRDTRELNDLIMCTVSVTSGLVFLAVSIAVLLPVNGAREEDIEEALDGHSKSSSQAAAAAAANRALLLTGMQYYNGRLGDGEVLSH